MRDRWSGFSFTLGRLLLLGILALAIFLAICWQAVLTSLGGFLVDSQPPRQADLILVLGGDFWGPRVITGADLAKRGYAPIALFSGPPYHDRPQGELSVEFLVKQGYPREVLQAVAIEARSTIAEAEALRGELARRRVKRVLLVTSSYHTRRATIVLTLFCPGVQFISIPSPDSHYHVAEWWNDESSRNLFYSEWSKILGSLVLGVPNYALSRLAGR